MRTARSCLLGRPLAPLLALAGLVLLLGVPGPAEVAADAPDGSTRNTPSSEQAQPEPQTGSGKADERPGASDPGSYTPRPSGHGADAHDLALASRRAAGVVHVKLEGTIDLGLAALMKRVFEEHADAGVLLLDINTLGGRVDAAIQIRDALLASKAKTIAFVHPRAISAGALIALACDVIAVAPGGSIGAATPIQLGSDGAEPVAEKMVSYFRTEMRTTAEAKGRRGDIAEAMVDASVAIPGLDPAGKLLTMDTDTALEFGIAELRASDVGEVLAGVDLAGAVPTAVAQNWAEKLVRFLTDPVVSGFLMSIGTLGLMIELYAPGLGLPGALGVLCLSLFFGGHLIVNLAGLEELILLAVGCALLALEVFVIPGFGAAGIAGILCIVAALVLTTIGLPLGVLLQTGAWVEPLTRVALALGVTLVLMIVALRFLPRTRAMSGLVLSSTLASNVRPEGPTSFVSADETSMAGQLGVAVSDLRPVGVALFGERRVDVISEGGYVGAGSAVRVVEVEGARIVVRAESSGEQSA
jgi:membrane-bound serine protease (ClpP class)